MSKASVSVGPLYRWVVGLAWVSPWIAYALYIAVAVVWFVPDRRLSPLGDVMARQFGGACACSEETAGIFVATTGR